jgi:hypothetical protein
MVRETHEVTGIDSIQGCGLVYRETVGATTEVIYDLVHLLFQAILLGNFTCILHDEFVLFDPLSREEPHNLVAQARLCGENEPVAETHGQLQVLAQVLPHRFGDPLQTFVVDVGFAPLALVRVTFTIVFCTNAFCLIQTIVFGLALTPWESSQAVKFAAAVRLAEEIVPIDCSHGT